MEPSDAIDRRARLANLAADVQFEQNSEPTVGLLLRVLAAAVPDQGRILEIGTGCGIGTSWLVEGVEHRDDVEVVTVETDGSLVRRVQDVDGRGAFSSSLQTRSRPSQISGSST